MVGSGILACLSVRNGIIRRVLLTALLTAALPGCICLSLLLPSRAVAATHHIVITDNAFTPSSIAIAEGDEVSWEWQAVDPHNVYLGRIPGETPMPYDGAFSSPLAINNYTYSVTFSREFLNSNPSPDGDYHFYCQPHFTMGMRGVVAVSRPAENFRTSLDGGQVVPPNGTTAGGNCSVVLNGNETQVDISCSPSFGGGWNATFAVGSYGDVASETVCDFSSSPTTCAISRDQVDKLIAADTFIQITKAGAVVRGQVVRVNGNFGVSGRVVTADGIPVPNVQVSLGRDATVSSSSEGTFLFTNVPSGFYLLRGELSGFKIDPPIGRNPVIVTDVAAEGRDLRARPDDSSCVTDTDGDGLCDLAEDIFGSNKLDPGSRKDRLKSPIYLLWNGFLSIRNIIEIVNKDFATKSVTLSLFDISGNLVSTLPLSIFARGQRDVILNDLPGFQANSYGLVGLTFDEDAEGLIDGRISYYRDSTTAGEFEFAFAVPFGDPTFGTTAVGFNTFQPSTDPTESSHLVSQWLSIVNLHQSVSKSFTVRRYGMAGEFITEVRLDIPPFGRMDIEGGHQNPGPQRVGLNVIIPDDPSSPYIGHLYRYGGQAGPGEPVTSYRFAFPLIARSGSGGKLRTSISSGAGASNWVEIANASNQSVSADVHFFSNAGQLLASQQLSLAPYAQQHLDASSLLSAGASGSVEIESSSVGSLLGQSMFYFREPNHGQILGMYGAPLQMIFGRRLLGSYNLFLGMFNWLRISNSGDSPLNVNLSVFSPLGSENSRSLSLPAHSGTDFGLHESSNFGTSPNTYGVIELAPESAAKLHAEILRIKPRADGLTDFVAPTAVR